MLYTIYRHKNQFCLNEKYVFIVNRGMKVKHLYRIGYKYYAIQLVELYL